MINFLQPLKFSHDPNDIFVWGCLHYGHDPKWETPLWKMRGFDSSLDHDIHIFDTLRKTLKPTSILFLLGDSAFGRDAKEKLSNLLDSIPFRFCYIMPGNHTAGYKQLLENSQPNLQLEYGEGKKIAYFIPNYLDAIINGQSVVMSHYPILSWNGQGRGSYMLYSHVHGSLVKSEIGRMYKQRGRSLEVSVEASEFPFSFSRIQAILDNISVFSPDHHDESTQNPF